MLRAVQVVVEEGLARPILIGRPEVIEARVEKLGLRLRGRPRLRAVQPEQRPALQRLCRLLPRAHRRARASRPASAREALRTRRTRDRRGDAGARRGRRHAGRARSATSPRHLRHITDVIGLRPEMSEASTVHALVLDGGALFIADTSVSYDPTPALIAETAIRGRGTPARLRARAQGGAGQPQQFRQPRHALRAQDARGPGVLRRLAPGARGRRRDAGRHRPPAGDPRPAPARLDAEGRRPTS